MTAINFPNLGKEVQEAQGFLGRINYGGTC